MAVDLDTKVGQLKREDDKTDNSLFKEDGVIMYIRKIGDTTVTVICAANPEANYAQYFSDIEKKILSDGYEPETSMGNLISLIISHFDCDDNYGEHDSETGFGGYGTEFTLEECFRYIKESGGWKEFDYEA